MQSYLVPALWISQPHFHIKKCHRYFHWRNTPKSADIADLQFTLYSFHLTLPYLFLPLVVSGHELNEITAVDPQILKGWAHPISIFSIYFNYLKFYEFFFTSCLFAENINLFYLYTLKI